MVGSIVVLADPISMNSLANLLDIPREVIYRKLDTLHSVINVPTNPDLPIRLLHSSFRDFLLDANRRGKNLYCVDEREAHRKVAFHCLNLLTKTDRLRQDICALGKPGKLRSEIDCNMISKHLPMEVQYACRRWVQHLGQSEYRIFDHDEVHNFLDQRFLHWLEALSLTGRITDAITMITTLQNLIKPNNSSIVGDFLNDAGRFILMNVQIFDTAPLQLYSSAIVFAPETSIVRNKFKTHIPSWLIRLPLVPEAWNVTLKTLRGHSDSVYSVAFSFDGKQLALEFSNDTIKLWDAASGAL